MTYTLTLENVYELSEKARNFMEENPKVFFPEYASYMEAQSACNCYDFFAVDLFEKHGIGVPELHFLVVRK